jgi:hypothetical protein
MAPCSTSIPDLNESSTRGAPLIDNATCASRQSPNPKRSITFYPLATVHTVLHINDYSEEEIASARYDKDELATMKMTDVINTLSMMKRGMKIHEEGRWYCRRGLESLTREGSTRRRANMTNAWNAVLDEQDLQWGKDICDPQAIADAYYGVSRDCHDAAVMKATQYQDTASSKVNNGEGASFAFGSKGIAPQSRKISSKAA